MLDFHVLIIALLILHNVINMLHRLSKPCRRCTRPGSSTGTSRMRIWFSNWTPTRSNSSTLDLELSTRTASSPSLKVGISFAACYLCKEVITPSCFCLN